VGKYKSEEMIQCEMCPAGSISEVQGQPDCFPCGDGKISNLDRTDCGECICDLFLTRE